MSESTSLLADFTGMFTVEGTWDQEPVDGRVLLNPEQLVLVGPDGKEAVPLSRVIDIGLGQVPQAYSQYFNDSVMVAFESAGRGPPKTAMVEAESDIIDQFGTLLFKTQLHERTVLLNHPARIGGHIADGGYGHATLFLGEEGVTFGDIETPFRLPLDSVVGFSHIERTVQDAKRRVLSIRHIQDGTSMTTEMTVRSGRLRNLLGRHLRAEYNKRRSELEEIALSSAEKELLVALHSGGSAANLAEVLGVDPGQVSMLLNALEDDGLLTTGEDSVHLTSTGQIALEEHLEEINS